MSQQAVKIMDDIQRVIGADGLGRFIVVATQIVTILRFAQPVMVMLATLRLKVLRLCYRLVILHSMRGLQQNCRLRTLAYKATDTMLDVVREQPGGYSWWGLLPRKGQGNIAAVRKKIADVILSTLFTESFLVILIQAAITSDGVPRKGQLYQWLLVYVYAGSVQRLYKDWLAVKDRHCEV